MGAGGGAATVACVAKDGGTLAAETAGCGALTLAGAAAAAGTWPPAAAVRVTMKTALQRAQRARTPAGGTFSGSTRNTV